jgi:hypothetical protein
MIIYVTIRFKAGIVPTRRRQAYHRRPRPGRTKKVTKELKLWFGRWGGEAMEMRTA